MWDLLWPWSQGSSVLQPGWGNSLYHRYKSQSTTLRHTHTLSILVKALISLRATVLIHPSQTFVISFHLVSRRGERFRVQFSRHVWGLWSKVYSETPTHPPTMLSNTKVLYSNQKYTQATYPYFNGFALNFKIFRKLVLYIWLRSFHWKKWNLKQYTFSWEPVPVGWALLFLFFYPDFPMFPPAPTPILGLKCLSWSKFSF